jgi:hypothetical protein
MRIVQADCLDFLRAQEPDSLDLVFGSPPYEGARLYLEDGKDLQIARDTETWVAWLVEVYQAALRACRGLVALVVEGSTRDYRYSAGPLLLAADLHRAGVCLRKPVTFHRLGIPGSGGPDWLRNDCEWILCATRGGQLPWSDNTACGHAPKWAPGGAMSHRMSDGERVNQWGGHQTSGAQRRKQGHRQKPGRPSHQAARSATSGHKNGDTQTGQGYHPPALANPGNVAEQLYTAAEVAQLLSRVEAGDYLHCNVGGQMGSDLAHANEAPFPEALAEFVILAFCPPAGLVCDPFLGSGTTAAVALRHGRNFTGCDLRASQVDLARRRVGQETPALFPT